MFIALTDNIMQVLDLQKDAGEFLYELVLEAPTK